MLDPKFLIEHHHEVRANFERRNDPDLLRRFDTFVGLHERAGAARKLAQDKRHARNSLTKMVADAKRMGVDPASIIAKAREVDEELVALEKSERDLKSEATSLLRGFPNLLLPNVPNGAGEDDNWVVREWGVPREFTFEPRPHGDLAVHLGLADFERAAKVAGAGFAYLLGDLALMEMALQRFAVDQLVRSGFTLVQPPYMMRQEAYANVAAMEDFENVMFRVGEYGDKRHLIATAEHPIAAMFQGEILPEEALPLRYVGVSPCFRREIGSNGVDTRGLFRMHQFHKVEQFTFMEPDLTAGMDELGRLVTNAEALWRALGIPYRVVSICAGDMGAVAAKKYDIEAWSPRHKAYKEVVSASLCTDWQARRLNIRVGKPGQEGKRVPYTLNSTAIATSRALVMVLENYQNEDGTVEVPKALQPYMNGTRALVPATRKV